MVPRGCPEPQLAAAYSDLSPVDPIGATTETGMMRAAGRSTSRRSPEPSRSCHPDDAPRSFAPPALWPPPAPPADGGEKPEKKNTWRVRASQLTPRQLLEESARPSEHHLLRGGGDENKGVGGWWWWWEGGGCLPGDRGGLHGISSRKSPLCLY